MKLLRVEDVAEILSCSTKEVYSLKDRGVLPFCKIGGMVRFRAVDVTEMISSSLTSREQRRSPASSLPRLRSL
jgi:excisionase family DNA binding protein